MAGNVVLSGSECLGLRSRWVGALGGSGVGWDALGNGAGSSTGGQPSGKVGSRE